jgi:hypothetical protein
MSMTVVICGYYVPIAVLALREPLVRRLMCDSSLYGARTVAWATCAIVRHGGVALVRSACSAQRLARGCARNAGGAAVGRAEALTLPPLPRDTLPGDAPSSDRELLRTAVYDTRTLDATQHATSERVDDLVDAPELDPVPGRRRAREECGTAAHASQPERI